VPPAAPYRRRVTEDRRVHHNRDMTSSKWSAADLPDLTGRTAVVTGANSGIGRVAASELARAGARVTLAVRNTAKGETAARSMPGTVTVRPLDLTDLASIHAFAEGTEGDIDILVDNAGVMMTPKEQTRDGFELQIGTNHLGHFALTNLLLPRVTDRVVVVSSGAHRGGKVDLADLNWEKRTYRSWAAYGQSKLANLLFVLELQSRLDAAGSTVRAVAVHPGYAATNLQSQTGNRVANVLGGIGNMVLAQSDTMGALPTLYGATADVAGGSFVGPDGFQHLRGHPTIETPSAAARDRTMAAGLWGLSERLTGVTWPTLPAPA
jgi:NAD(P)-dependent dehydrogenase (short-subunit alcohol dehydrogenase family)